MTKYLKSKVIAVEVIHDYLKKHGFMLTEMFGETKFQELCRSVAGIILWINDIYDKFHYYSITVESTEIYYNNMTVIIECLDSSENLRNLVLLLGNFDEFQGNSMGNSMGNSIGNSSEFQRNFQKNSRTIALNKIISRRYYQGDLVIDYSFPSKLKMILRTDDNLVEYLKEKYETCSMNFVEKFDQIRNLLTMNDLESGNLSESFEKYDKHIGNIY